MKIAAMVILYHPCQETIDNINSYYDYADKIYVFDNTEQQTILKDQLLLQTKISYHHNGRNEGIAKRLNEAAHLCIADEFDWLMLMDQDSGFTEPMIKNYLQSFHQYKCTKNIAMFGVNFEQDIQADLLPCTPVFSTELITSGTLLNLSLFQKIGGFNENLFIDAVDHEYTIKSLLAGYKIVQFPYILLTHQIGTLVKRASIKTLFLIKKTKKLHSPLRCYYVYRNNLYLQQKYKNTDVINMQKLNKISKSIIYTTLYYGRNSFKLMQYIFQAKKDFKDNKMGKYSDN